MDKIIWDAIENEHEFLTSMDGVAAELRALGIDVDIPYAFADIPYFEDTEYTAVCGRCGIPHEWHSEELDCDYWIT